MAYEQKTKPTDASVQAFIEQIEQPRKKEDAYALLDIFAEATGEKAKMWGPSIIGFGKYHYRYESGHEGEAALAGFSPRKAAISLYLMLPEDRQAAFLGKLGKHKKGKGCIYVNKLADIDVEVLKEMVQESVRHLRHTYETEAGKQERTQASIAKRLGLDKFPKKAVLNKERGNPTDFSDLATYDTELSERKYDLIFAYVLTIDELKEAVLDAVKQERLNPGGYLYIAYPKIGNKRYGTSVHRDEIFPSLGVDDGNGYVGDSTIKFARMVKLDETFTVVGLKNDAKGKGKAAAVSSGKVADYEVFIPEIKSYLRSHPEIASLFDSLTPGYQRDWARYVYSAKQAATQEKRKAEMMEILAKGYKTKNLYLQMQKENR